jgi:hypothetical protein
MMTERPTTLHQALMGGQARLVSANLSQTIEALDFLKRRIERDRQMMIDLSHAPDSAAAVGVMTAFCQRSLSDYVSEAARLSSLIAATAERVNAGASERATDRATGLRGDRPSP